jgi:hypothetical protein
MVATGKRALARISVPLALVTIGLVPEPAAQADNGGPFDVSPASARASSPAAPSEFTHRLRVGPSAFAAVGMQGNCLSHDMGCVLPFLSHYGGGGLRFDYSMEKGRSNVRWHVVAAVEISFAHGTHEEDSYVANEPCCDMDISRDQKRYNGPYVGTFMGTGFRVDTDPGKPVATIFECDGTIGGSMTHVGVLGLHLALGARSGEWEGLASIEGDVLLYGKASAALMIGHLL